MPTVAAAEVVYNTAERVDGVFLAAGGTKVPLQTQTAVVGGECYDIRQLGAEMALLPEALQMDHNHLRKLKKFRFPDGALRLLAIGADVAVLRRIQDPLPKEARQTVIQGDGIRRRQRLGTNRGLHDWQRQVVEHIARNTDVAANFASCCRHKLPTEDVLNDAAVALHVVLHPTLGGRFYRLTGDVFELDVRGLLLDPTALYVDAVDEETQKFLRIMLIVPIKRAMESGDGCLDLRRCNGPTRGDRARAEDFHRQRMQRVCDRRFSVDDQLQT